MRTSFFFWFGVDVYFISNTNSEVVKNKNKTEVVNSDSCDNLNVENYNYCIIMQTLRQK